MTNRFTKTSFFVQGGIMGVPSDGTPKRNRSHLVHLKMILPIVNGEHEDRNFPHHERMCNGQKGANYYVL